MGTSLPAGQGRKKQLMEAGETRTGKSTEMRAGESRMAGQIGNSVYTVIIEVLYSESAEGKYRIRDVFDL